MDFTTMDISTLTRSVTGEGVRYLELFLKEYSSVFPGQLNPSCPKCLTQYLTKYKNHYNTMANTSPYRLHAKYENIPLEFGSHILVNNSNITTPYALKLLEQPGGERFFAHLPLPKAKRTRIKKVVTLQEETTDEVVPEATDIPDNSIPQ